MICSNMVHIKKIHLVITCHKGFQAFHELFAYV